MTEAERARLVRETTLLFAGEHFYGLPSMPTVSQLINEAMRPLPDTMPRPPAWLPFEWPKSGEVDCRTYWRQVDRGGELVYR
jgi:hypothetical protein